MLVPQLYFDGKCSEAIKMYEKAFETELDSIMYEDEDSIDGFVIHAEMYIHGQRVMLSDGDGGGGSNKNLSLDTGMQLVVTFENRDQLNLAYETMNDECKSIMPMASTFYSECVVVFLDRFGINWCFMI